MSRFQFNQPDAVVVEGGICAPIGFSAAGIHCGIKRKPGESEDTVSQGMVAGNEPKIDSPLKKDLALVYCTTRCKAAAVYTQNAVKGACIAVTRRNIADGYARAIICNSGNANTCNADGEDKAQAMCRLAADALGIEEQDVIVASTGVIGQVLPIKPIERGVPVLAANLNEESGSDAADAIMTTDTFRKEFAIEFELGGRKVRIGGMCKGSGMIHPNMATMLCFITTDVAIAREMLRKAIVGAVGDSFNMLSVDGDTSTNDMMTVMASGLAGNKVITTDGEDYRKFKEMLRLFCIALCREMARDGEGATKLVECAVTGARDKMTARTIAKSVICSSLLKAAMFGADANWGRVLCAIGYSGARCDIKAVDVAFVSGAGRIEVCKKGAGVLFSENDAKRILSEDEIVIEVTLHDGDSSATAYGCDLTYDYVKINGDYRT